MIEFLESLDTKLLLAINGCNSPLFDNFFYYISQTLVSLPIYIFVIWNLFVLYKNMRGWIVLMAIILSVGLSDLISVNFFKEVFLRFRPSHNLLIQDSLHYVKNYKGGMYGFVSSHAANTFAFAIISSLFIRRKNVIIILCVWASIVSYSRIYLGVHYPADVFVGACVGTTVSIVLYRLYVMYAVKLPTKQ